jgi:hypothetical protein
MVSSLEWFLEHRCKPSSGKMLDWSGASTNAYSSRDVYWIDLGRFLKAMCRAKDFLIAYAAFEVLYP